MKRIVKYILYSLKFKGVSIKFNSTIKNTHFQSKIRIEKQCYISDSIIKENCRIKEKSRLIEVCLKGNNIIHENTRIFRSEIGKFTYIASNSYIINAKIGAFCSIGNNVFIASMLHPIERMSTHPIFYSNNQNFGIRFVDDNPNFVDYNNIIIGNDVWIGAGAILLPGIEIEDGAIIGAGSVVTKNVPAYSIFAGNPAKFIRKRFSNELITKLFEMKWWGWNVEKIQENIELFSNDPFKSH